jgi:hypothetical protein
VIKAIARWAVPSGMEVVSYQLEPLRAWPAPTHGGHSVGASYARKQRKILI